MTGGYGGEPLGISQDPIRSRAISSMRAEVNVGPVTGGPIDKHWIN